MSDPSEISEPFSRIVRLDALPAEGETFALEATPEERAALARSYKLPSIEALTASLTVRRASRGGARVTGGVHGELTQTCVVSLDPFPAVVDEEVDVRFAPPTDDRPRPADEPFTVSMDEDEPDSLIDGKIDLGALAAEFFAIGLDPYPRKPGVVFEPSSEEPEELSPFTVLRGKGDAKP
jgi:hypothetical protein